MLRLLVMTTLLFGSVIGHASNDSDVVVLPQTDEKIINGVQTDIRNVPYQISLHRVYSWGKYEHVCGGSIISQYWVLTAAHCVQANRRPDAYIILAGSTIVQHSSTSTHHYLSAIYVHNGFRDLGQSGLINDLALMKVQNYFKYDAYRQPIPLIGNHVSVPEFTSAQVTGWGSVNPRQYEPSYVLRSASVPIISKDVCSRYFSSFIRDGQLCIGNYKNNQGSCHGDSGGPLVVNGQLIGVVSWGHPPCVISSFPTVFVEVAFYRQWITYVSGV